MTAWYVATFAIVLATLGVLLFTALAHDLSIGLDTSLRAATREIATERWQRAPSATDAVSLLPIPESQLYLFDLEGRLLTPGSSDAELRKLVVAAAAKGSASNSWDAPGDLSLQAYAERFTTSSGAQYVAAAVVNRDTIDDRYATLLSLVGGLGALGLILVASGGILLARKSVAPVERSMEQMRRFMADAAHEMRTPVAVMRSRVEVTLERPRDAAAYEAALSDLRGEVERMGTLVNDLLTLARADAAFSPARVQLDEVVMEAVATAGWIASRRAIELTVSEAEEVVIDGDPVLLRQLVLIVLDNAIKFSRDGGTVAVALHARADGCELTVDDRGVGIGDADPARIFDRFYRGDTVRGTSAGAGLGLAIARWITEVHGAHIAIAPGAECGTRVTITFPTLPAASA
jgi:signal transduction histidine kinase